MYVIPDPADTDALTAASTHERRTPWVDDLKLLGRFRTKMAAQSQMVNVARMMYDLPYAYERIARAQETSDEALQRLALTLFSLYPQPQVAAH